MQTQKLVDVGKKGFQESGKGLGFRFPTIRSPSEVYEIWCLQGLVTSGESI